MTPPRTFRAPPPTPDALARLRAWRLDLDEAALQSTPHPFLALTPLGLPHRGSLGAMLDDLGIKIGAQSPIEGWARASSGIYTGRSTTDERLKVALAFEALWRARCPQDTGERWQLDTPEDLARLALHKDALRRVLGIEPVRLLIEGVSLWSGGTIKLQTFHAPDLEDFELESRRLGVIMKAP